MQKDWIKKKHGGLGPMVDFECMISNIAATRGPQEDVELKKL